MRIFIKIYLNLKQINIPKVVFRPLCPLCYGNLPPYSCESDWLQRLES